MRIIRFDRPTTTPTTLYFIETMCPERHIKIGIASSVRNRMVAIQGNCPYRLRLIKRVPDAAHMERELHKRFAKDRLFGEWFRRSEELMAAIEELDGFDTLEKPAPGFRGSELDYESDGIIDDMLCCVAPAVNLRPTQEA